MVRLHHSLSYYVMCDMAGRYAPMAGRYAPMAGRYAPMAGRYAPMAGRYAPMAGRYAPMAGRYALLSSKHASVAAELVRLSGYQVITEPTGPVPAGLYLIHVRRCCLLHTWKL